MTNHITVILESIVARAERQYGINRYGLAHGWCNVFTMAAKREISEATIVASDFGGLIDEHEFLFIGGKYYDAQDTSGVESPEKLKYFHDFSHVKIPANYMPRTKTRNLSRSEAMKTFEQLDWVNHWP